MQLLFCIMDLVVSFLLYVNSLTRVQFNQQIEVGKLEIIVSECMTSVVSFVTRSLVSPGVQAYIMNGAQMI
jgi:hypothetical protein